MPEIDGENKERGSKSGRKPFKRPHLLVYGELKNITKTVGNSGGNDGGSGSNKRTH